MMRFTDTFIKRPVLAGVLNVLILLIGMNALSKLQVRQYPELTNTVITVTTAYPGASADLMQGFVTTPIQQSVASAEGVEYITSTSRQSMSVVQAHIQLNFPPDVAMTEVMSKVQEVNSQLPREIHSPVILKSTGETHALLYVSFSSDQMTNTQITDYLKRQIQPRLSTIDGVAKAEILGGQSFAMRLWLNPQKMAARNISTGMLFQALAQNNYQSAPGQVKGYYTVTNVEANTGLQSVEEFEQMIVYSDDDQIVRLRDIASVELAAQSYDSVVKLNTSQSVFIGVSTTPAGNPLTVIKEVRQTLDELRNHLPPTLNLDYAYDATEFIQASVDEVASTLIQATLIVIAIMFLFLGNFRAVIIPLVTIPLSIIGVMLVLYMCGFTINLLTLLAMVLAIGLVVDDAIVVVENVYRHIAEGVPPFRAAVVGTREIALPVITMTVTLMAVYAPIAFMGGMTGALFREFALTLAGAVVVSGIVALTLSPMMCAKMLKSDALQGPYALKVDKKLEQLSHIYRHYLTTVLQHGRAVLLIFVIVMLSIGIFLKFTPQELAPQEDQSAIMMMSKAPQYANTDYMYHFTNQLIDACHKIPESALTFTVAGLSAHNDGFGGLILKPWNQRKRSSHQIVGELQGAVSDITGMSIFTFQPPALPGSMGGLPIQFVINSMASYEVVYQVMEDLKNAARQSGLFMVVDSDLSFDNPQVKLNINRPKASQIGVTMQEIGQTLALMMGGNYVNHFSLLGRSYQVIPMAPRTDRLSPEALSNYYVSSTAGALIPLGTIADIQVVSQPAQLFQFNQMNAATFQALPFPGVKMGEAIDFLLAYAKSSLPEGFTFDFLSESRQYIQEGNALMFTFLFALIVIFLVLAAQFESLRDPFVIMLSVPMSLFGALLFLFLGASTLNIYSQIGLITLVGLITKHGILIVEFANQLQLTERMTRQEAIVQAATLRLRPILMTTAAMVMGLIPLLIARGAGAESRFSIGIVVVSGMLIGTFFTIFVVPTFYLMLSKQKTAIEIDF